MDLIKTREDEKEETVFLLFWGVPGEGDFGRGDVEDVQEMSGGCHG